MSPRRHGPTGPFARFAHLLSAAATAGRKPRLTRSLDAHRALRLESLESRAMLSSVPFIASLPQDLAGKTASLFTVHGRYGNNALNGDWELGLTSNTSAPPQNQVDRTWNSGTREPFTFSFTNTRPDTFTNSLNATFSIGGSGVQFNYGSQFASYEPNAIKIWARTTTATSGVTINDLKITTPGVPGETLFPGTSIAVSQASGTVFQEIIIAGIDFQSTSGGAVTLQGNVTMQFGADPALRGSALQFHVIATHIPWVDLDVDSNNDGTIDLTNGRRGTDDRIEQAGVPATTNPAAQAAAPTGPGVIIPVGGDRAEMLVTLAAGRNAMLEVKPEAAGKLKFYTQREGGEPLAFHTFGPNDEPAFDMGLVPGREPVGATDRWTLWVEAIDPSTSMADIVFTLTGDDSGPPARDIVRGTAATVDLSIDELPADIEDGSGAIIWRNSDFSRRIPDTRQSEPGVPRYQPDYKNAGAIDPEFSGQFTKARATFTTGMAAGCEFRFVFQPAVTLWTRTEWKGFVKAADGWWKIPSGTNVGPKKITDDTLDFWVEGLEATGYGKGTITFEAIPLAPAPIGQPRRLPPADTANFTVIDAGIGVDGNRDGTIDFTDSYDRQLSFWLNDDHEIVDDPQFGSPYETEDALYATKDSADTQIATKRDLEDFAAIHFLEDSTLTTQMFQSLNATPAPVAARPTYRFSLKLKSADPANQPQIRLFRNRPNSGPLDHVSNTDAARMLVSDPAAEEVIGQGDTILQSLALPDRDHRFRHLFEALGTAGRASLEYTVTVTYAVPTNTGGQPRSTSRTHTLDLDLRNITDFYTRMQVPYRLANGVDARYAAFSPTDKVLPHFADAVPLSQSNTATMPFLRGSGTVVLVHGWNMSDGTQTDGPKTDWKKAFAETAFKRLYWQGVRGEFASFDWPTFSNSEGPAFTENLNLSYNASEFQAFRSGQSLMNFLDRKQAGGPVHLLAHSMGNVVAAEALRQWTVAGKAQPLVTTYTAMQGAISAGAYGDDTRSALGLTTSTTDYYRYWPSGTAGHGRPYMEGTGGASGKWINMFNPVDAATSGDRFGWVANNLQKPFAGAIWRDFFVQPPRRFAYRLDVGGGLLRSYATPTGVPVNDGVLDLKPWLVAPGQQQLPGLAAYEIMAFMAKANARPIGTKEVETFGTNIDINDLGLPSRYADQWSAHSFQFHFDAATTSQFWKRVVDETKMDTVR